MRGFQTTLQTGKIPELEEFKKSDGGAFQYVMEKYRQWKKLKEREKNGGAYNANTV